MSTDPRADTARPAASATPPAPSRFDTWMVSRPLIGGILVVLAGIEMFFSTQLDLGNLHIQVGIEGMQATILPITLVVLGVLAIVSPSQRLFYGILTLVVAIYSLVAVNLGGFLVGMLLGVVGGIVVVTWAPQRDDVVLDGAGASGGVVGASGDRAGVPDRALEAGVPVDAGAGATGEVEQASDDRTVKANADRSADVGMRRDRVRPVTAASADDLAHADDLAVVTGALSSAPEPPPFPAAPADTGAATPAPAPGTIPAPLPARAGSLTLTLLAAVIVSGILTSGLAAPSARADDVGGCSGSSCAATPTPDPGPPGEPVPGSTPTSTPGPTPSVPTPSVPTPSVPTTATPTSTPTSSPTPPTSGPDDGTTHGSAGGSGGSARGDTDPAAAAATAAATPAPPVIADALYPGATAQVSGSSLGLIGGRFVGVTTATLLDGRTVPVLRITADQMSIADFSLDAPAAGGRRQPNTASRMSADARVELLVVSLGGTLADGTGIRFDAAAPPPDGTLLPGLTGPVMELVSITGDSLRLVGSHQQVPVA
ncbi:DUF6114 domain-containing protein [Glaciibacter flavus]|uniref:DUF6114 domain-containing protein n=1 Tax=Orlajensenia flava TaxID=2565934 RepID=UPI003B00B230